MSTNIAMVKLMQRSGMCLHYVRSEYFLLNDERVDSVHYCKRKYL